MPQELLNPGYANTELPAGLLQRLRPDIPGAEALKEPRRPLRSSNPLPALLVQKEDKLSPTATKPSRATESYQGPSLYPLKNTQERNRVRGSKRPGLLPSSCVGDPSSSSITSLP